MIMNTEAVSYANLPIVFLGFFVCLFYTEVTAYFKSALWCRRNTIKWRLWFSKIRGHYLLPFCRGERYGIFDRQTCSGVTIQSVTVPTASKSWSSLSGFCYKIYLLYV